MKTPPKTKAVTPAPHPADSPAEIILRLRLADMLNPADLDELSKLAGKFGSLDTALLKVIECGLLALKAENSIRLDLRDHFTPEEQARIAAIAHRSGRTPGQQMRVLVIGAPKANRKGGAA